MKYGEVDGVVFKTWGRALAHMTKDQIRAGFKACWTREDTWPPELQEFVNMCMNSSPKAYHRPFMKALPVMRAQPRVVEEEREKLKKLGYLGGKNEQ
jgi:hypothetical protein